MKIEQAQWDVARGWTPSRFGELGPAAQVVLVFGRPSMVEQSGCRAACRQVYPHAILFGCSTGGEIADTRVTDDTVTLTAIAFQNTTVATAHTTIDGPEQSFDAGVRLVQQFKPAGLRHIFALSEGLHVNASELVRGMNSALPPGVALSGGCAADGNRLTATHVWCDSAPRSNFVAALGFYGEHLRIGVSAIGGWKPFGPDRLITKSKQHVLFELDGRPALALYKQYLGKHAEGLPATGLQFPLELRVGAENQRVLRAILAVDEAEQSITFAGTVPEGAYARFMVGQTQGLLQATEIAARTSLQRLGSLTPDLSILVSCNGRRFVLKQRVEEEVEAVREVLGPHTKLTGFYSYGEIAAPDAGGPAELHNETMTITSLTEVG
ncbi:MAG TPA: FIST N-terminal domain-containing protein [Opitutaceae bacterium]|nr:FIST N-terminal domain-containing protein [Opitutaceae bacterium]